jgi:hypothetical protein
MVMRRPSIQICHYERCLLQEINYFNYAAWIDKIDVGRKRTRTRFNKRIKTRTKMKIKFYFRNLKFPEHENASKINF